MRTTEEWWTLMGDHICVSLAMGVGWQRINTVALTPEPHPAFLWPEPVLSEVEGWVASTTDSHQLAADNPCHTHRDLRPSYGRSKCLH